MKCTTERRIKEPKKCDTSFEAQSTAVAQPEDDTIVCGDDRVIISTVISAEKAKEWKPCVQRRRNTILSVLAFFFSPSTGAVW